MAWDFPVLRGEFHTLNYHQQFNQRVHFICFKMRRQGQLIVAKDTQEEEGERGGESKSNGERNSRPVFGAIHMHPPK